MGWLGIRLEVTINDSLFVLIGSVKKIIFVCALVSLAIVQYCFFGIIMQKSHSCFLSTLEVVITE